MKRTAVVLFVALAVLAATPCQAILAELAAAVFVAELNRNLTKPVEHSSVTLDVTAEIRWQGQTIAAVFPLIGGAPLYVLRGSEVVFWVTPIKKTPGGVRDVVVDSAREGLVSRVREAGGDKIEVTIPTGELRGPFPAIFPVTVDGVFPNGRERHGFLNTRTRVRMDSQQAFFRIMVLDHDAIERLLNNEEVQRALGYLGGPGVSPLVPPLPGSGPRYRLDPEIAERFLLSTPSAQPVPAASQQPRAAPNHDRAREEPRGSAAPARQERTVPREQWRDWLVEVLAPYVGYGVSPARVTEPTFFKARSGERPFVHFIVDGDRIRRPPEWFYLLRDGVKYRAPSRGNYYLVVHDFGLGERIAPLVEGVGECGEVEIRDGQGVWYPVVVP